MSRGEPRLRACGCYRTLCKHFDTNGVTLRIHRNRERVPQNPYTVLNTGGPGWRGGGLAGQLCTDARTKDCKTNPLQCARYFEYDTPFHCVLSKSKGKLL